MPNDNVAPPAESLREMRVVSFARGPVVNSGECRFNAPNVQHYPDKMSSAWPFIQRTDWCAQFKERARPAPDREG